MLVESRKARGGEGERKTCLKKRMYKRDFGKKEVKRRECGERVLWLAILLLLLDDVYRRGAFS